MAHAKPINIAFPQVRNRQSVRQLNPTELGLYFSLMESCLIDGIDPLPSGFTELCRLTRATPKQWQYGGKAALLAFQDTYALLYSEYQRNRNKSLTRANNTKKTLATYWTKRKAERDIERNLIKAEAFNLSDQAHGAELLQPLKAQQYKPLNTDMIARKKAITAKANTKNQKFLIDKK